MEIQDIVTLLTLLKGSEVKTSTPDPTKHPAVGKYCVIRTYSAGVHAGEVISVSGTEVELRDSRRIYNWTGALSLSEVSQIGITGGKIAVVVPQLFLAEVIEILPMSEVAKKCLENK